MKISKSAIICLVLYFIITGALAQRPNIIVFMVDDMGWQDCSVPFAKEVTPLNKKFHTPNMEKLCSEGMKFTEAYSCSVCTPSRVSYLTGMNAARHHVTNWTSPEMNTKTDANDTKLSVPDWNINGLSPISGIPNTIYATPLPKLLKEAGYYTIHVGKAHWGPAGMPGSNPYNLGFMVNIAGNSIGHPQSYLGTENYGNLEEKTTTNAVPDLSEYFGSETFLTEALTREAIKAMDAPVRNKQPFFLNLAHYAVHAPIMGDKRFLQKYLDAGLDTIEAKYATLIEGMDKSLGDIMTYLKAQGIEKNTIIIFISDNGGLSLSTVRGGKKHTQNLPLRAGKGSLYEGGIREPMLVKWPEVVKPGTFTNQYIQIQDFYPTILEMAQIKQYKTQQSIDGQSIVPLLKDPQRNDTTRVLIWHYPNKWISDTTEAVCFASAIRKGDWKLIYLMREARLELYNLKNDLGEKDDLSKQYPVKTKELAKELTLQLKAADAQMPAETKTGLSVSWPNEVLK
jgi:arylsulfatase A-like enzyme